MTISPSSKLLVLRRDTATGFARVGWATDMPLGRFAHIEQVCETGHYPLDDRHPQYRLYCLACRRARHLNQALIDDQHQSLVQQGCVPVPLTLNDASAEDGADEFGSYLSSAMRALFRLTANVTEVWALIAGQTVVALQSCQPPRPMEALEYQVWKNHCLAKLAEAEGNLAHGKLVVRESGLWFCRFRQGEPPSSAD
jgi:hypothetical protein